MSTEPDAKGAALLLGQGRPGSESPVAPGLLADPSLDRDTKAILQVLYGEWAREMLPEMERGAAIKCIANLHRDKLILPQLNEEDGTIGLWISDKVRAEAEALREISPYLEAPLALERREGSALHKLQQALDDARLVNMEGSSSTVADALARPKGVFVIQHDWAAAFAGADETLAAAKDIKLPYDTCAFELRLSGKNVCAIVTEAGLAVAVETAAGWYIIDPRLWESDDAEPQHMHLYGSGPARLNELVSRQVLAILVALDAGVAETVTVYPSPKLCAARAKIGRRPPFAYHVVQLAARHSARAATAPAPSGRSGPRLHFRRGHWRHFEDRKTWINWTLVGDPDLGFIEKHYRL
jgi:hypothetical protein